MKHQEGSFHGAGGLELFYQRWRGDSQARATVAIVHGLGEHSGRYMNVVDHLVARGFAVYGYDLRGFGRSPGKRGHVDAWSQFRDDTGAFVRLAAGKEAERPLFLLGHSMGGLIVLDYVQHGGQALAGAIVSGPGLEPIGVAKPHLVALARVLSRLLPRFTLEIGLDSSAISRDPEVVRAYREDPLVHSRGSVRWGSETLDATARIKTRAADVKVPLLMVHGGEDRLVSVEGTRKFFDQVSFPDKELHVYDGVFHEPHNDYGYERVVSDYADWLEKHLE